MKYELIKKESFAVIGKLGSTADGDGFIAKLWQEANAHFEEVSSLAKKNPTVALQAFGGLCQTLK